VTSSPYGLGFLAAAGLGITSSGASATCTECGSSYAALAIALLAIVLVACLAPSVLTNLLLKRAARIDIEAAEKTACQCEANVTPRVAELFFEVQRLTARIAMLEGGGGSGVAVAPLANQQYLALQNAASATQAQLLAAQAAAAQAQQQNAAQAALLAQQQQLLLRRAAIADAASPAAPPSPPAQPKVDLAASGGEQAPHEVESSAFRHAYYRMSSS
jgi:hypothetical protein